MLIESWLEIVTKKYLLIIVVFHTRPSSMITLQNAITIYSFIVTVQKFGLLSHALQLHEARSSSTVYTDLFITTKLGSYRIHGITLKGALLPGPS